MSPGYECIQPAEPAGNPAPVSPAPAPAPTPQYSRRDFLGMLTAAAFSVNALFAAATLLKILQPPARSLDGKVRLGWLPVAGLADLSATTPKLVQYGEDWVYLTNRGGRVLGLNAACPHVRCKLAWDDAVKQYRCPCHTSGFDIAGKKLYGPAFRDMFPMMTQVESGRVMVGGWVQEEV